MHVPHPQLRGRNARTIGIVARRRGTLRGAWEAAREPRCARGGHGSIVAIACPGAGCIDRRPARQKGSDIWELTGMRRIERAG